MQRRSTLRLAVGALLLLVAGVSWATDVRGTLVCQANGKTIGGVQVRLDGANRSVTTDTDGKFVFPEVSQGIYTLSVFYGAEWYEYLRRVDVQGSDEVEITLLLPVEAPPMEERLVVTGKRYATDIALEPEAISVLEREDLERFAAEDLAGALRTIPGLHLYSGAGNSRDPALNVRGFTGGGENDYLLVLVDGVRINDINNARVDWREIPLDEVERVEVIRGPVSALWGDTGAGGVVQIFTRAQRESRWGAATEGGSFGTFGVRADVSDRIDKGSWSASVNHQQGDGYRDNAGWNDLQTRLSYRREPNERRNWQVSFWARVDDHDNPGALPDTVSDPTASVAPLDGLERDRVTLSWSDDRQVSDWLLASRASLRRQNDTLTETLLPLPPGSQGEVAPLPFNDTQRREFEGTQLWGESVVRRKFGLDERFDVSFGLEGQFVDFTSTVRPIGVDGAVGALTGDG